MLRSPQPLWATNTPAFLQCHRCLTCPHISTIHLDLNFVRKLQNLSFNGQGPEAGVTTAFTLWNREVIGIGALMTLHSILSQNKDAIVKQWFEKVVSSYPDDTARFLKSQKDPFANPVGQTTIAGLTALFDIILNGMDQETAISFLDPIIRIRAVQKFTPTRATRFILDLKPIVRDMLKERLSVSDRVQELLALEDRIDELALLAFDIFMLCREKVFELKANEMRNRTYRAFARAGLIAESADNPS